MKHIFLIIIVSTAFLLTGCGKSKQEELAEAQLKALQESQAKVAENEKKKQESSKKLTGGQGPTWHFGPDKK